MMGFDDIIERDMIKEHLRRAVSTRSPSHAYLLHGEEGSGKEFVARVFAQGLLCEGGDKPCGVCHACRQAAAGTHPDIKVVTHEKASISVEDIREQVVNDAGIKPYYGPYKVYLIPEAELMTAEAQNALLKTLEEPPEYCVMLLLCASAGTLLETILSRTVQIRMPALSDEAVAAYLMQYRHVPDYRAKVAARFARGNIGRALSLMDDEAFEQLKSGTLRMFRELKNLSANEAATMVKDLAGDKKDTAHRNAFFDLIRCVLRDLFVYKAVKDKEYLILGDDVSYISTVAESASYRTLVQANAALTELLSMLKANVSEEFALTDFVLTLRGLLAPETA